MKKNLSWQFATQAIHTGFTHDPTTGAIMPPIHLSSTFAQHAPGQPVGKFEYSRTANPTREILETNLAALERGRFGLAFASGCAALNTLLQSLAPHSHVIVSDDVYGGTLRLFKEVFQPWGLTFSQCDLTHPEQLLKHFTPQTRLIWLETPSNPLLKVLDIAAIVALNRQQPQPALVAVDNTFATPYLQNPLALGADMVCHSTTKYLGGHSDVVGGALIVNDEALAQQLHYLQNATGAVPSPLDCFLLLRSIKTLHVRMQAHCQNAKILAQYLSQHPKVKKVHYPGLASHPQHSLAQRQMRDFGGMLSVVLDGNQEHAIAFMQRLKLFTLAESLGGVESLVEHPATMTHAVIPLAHRQAIGIEDSLVRMSVGIEDIQDLLADVEQALEGI